MEYLAGYCTTFESSESFFPLESNSSSKNFNNDTSSGLKMYSKCMYSSDNAHEKSHLTEKDSNNSNTSSSTDPSGHRRLEDVFRTS